MPRGVLMPPIPALAGLPLTLAGLLPNRDHNADLLRGLRHWTDGEGGGVVAGVFVGDPLLAVERIGNTLRASGICDVVNLPSVVQHGRDEARVFDEPGIGRDRELEMMKRLASRGLRPSLAITGVEDLEPALVLEPRLVFVVSDFSWLAQDPDAYVKRLGQACDAVAAVLANCSPRPPLIAACGLAATVCCASADGFVDL